MINRPLLVIFSQYEIFAQAMLRFIQLAEENIQSYEFNPSHDICIYKDKEDIETFLKNRAVDRLINTLAIFDCSNTKINIDFLNPMAEGIPSQNTAASLLLEYPEIYWLIISPGIVGEAGQESRYPETFVNICQLWQLHIHLRRHQFGYRAIYDPSGIRARIKRNIQKENNIPIEIIEQSCPLCFRKPRAISIDEEKAQAFLNGYVSYKLGYRCDIVMTQALMEDLLIEQKGEGKPGIDTFQYDLTFEDLFINFPDKKTPKLYLGGEREFHISNLADRKEYFDKLPYIQHRNLVTGGHKGIKWHDINADTFRREIEEGIVGKARKRKIRKVIYKPLGGIYSLMDESGLLKTYWDVLKKKKSLLAYSQKNEGGNHSAPGKLLCIAEQLIIRAKTYLRDSLVPEHCIIGATLANEAVELLGYMTPITSFEAISVRHQNEVKAECMYYGVENDTEQDMRIKELKWELGLVSHWLNPRMKKKAEYNASIQIVSAYKTILSDFAQFDEEQKCLKYLRDDNRKLSSERKRFHLSRDYFQKQKLVKKQKLHPFHRVEQWALWYLHLLLNKTLVFMLMLLFWPTLFGLIQYAFDPAITKNIWTTLFDSIVTFLSLNPPEIFSATKIIWIKVIISLNVLAGFVHLGIFISYIYNKVARK
jgi:hypothetical protein